MSCSLIVVRGRQTYLSVTQHLTMSDPECFDPSLLPARQGDEKTQLDKFGFGEVGV
jgi:hypothetical protein